MAKADLNKFNNPPKGAASNAATHSTSTGGDPNRLSRAGGKARAGKIKSHKRMTTRGRGK